jgi:hypothetical protein
VIERKSVLPLQVDLDTTAVPHALPQTSIYSGDLAAPVPFLGAQHYSVASQSIETHI